MSCPRGAAAPDEHTKLRLFSSSGGYCQNPGCARELFIDTGSKRIHIAEMAHVFAAQDDGPRAKVELSKAERGEYGNLILLCSSCHTMIDKDEFAFPDELLRSWKRDHESRLENMFGAPSYNSRAEVLAAIQDPMQENRVIFEEYNPGLDYRQDPESETAVAWQRKMRERIIPNNRRILALLDANKAHMVDAEITTLELFRQHVYDLQARHFTDAIVGAQRRFPESMNLMMRAR